jgi:hypothetical protein
LLLGTLGFFMYVYCTYAFGIAYNRLFLLHVVLFSVSLFAFAAHCVSLLHNASQYPLGEGHRRPVGWFMFASALVLVVVWGVPLIGAAVTGTPPPRLDTYATFVTYAIDLGVIMPAAVVAGTLLLRGQDAGYVVAASLLVLEVLLAPLIALQTASQIRAGETFTAAEVAGPMGGFVVLATLALWALWSVLRAADSTAAT